MDVAPQERRVLKAAVDLGRMVHFRAGLDADGSITLFSDNDHEKALRLLLDREIKALLILLTIPSEAT